MANRFPLVINNSTTVVGELQQGDNLNLSLSGIYDGASSGLNGQVLKATGSGTVTWGSVGDVFLTTTQTLQNKTFTNCIFNALNNTLTNIPNGSLVNSSITINGTAIALGGSVTTPDNNATYSIGTSTSTSNQALIRLTGATGGSSSEFNIFTNNKIVLSRAANGDLTFGTQLSSLTPGTYLTGNAYNGLTAETWSINATSSGTNNGTIVARGTNGDFTAGTITATAFTTSGTISGGTITATGNVTGASIIKSGGTSSQFLKADGSVDSNVYLTSVGNGTLTLATSGTGISLGATTTFTANQSTNSTITISSNATSSGTTSGTIVARGTNGDFTAGSITATQFIRSGGTSAQFLKADGSIDSSTYLTTVTPPGNGTLTINTSGSGLSGSGTFTANQTGNTTVSLSLTSSAVGARFSIVPYVAGDGVMEIGRYIDFHSTNADTSDFTYRLDNSSNTVLVGSGSIGANSDVRLKKNITTIENSLEKVLSLRGVEYDRIDNNEHQIGLIAQEVEKIIPCLVVENDVTGIKAITYQNIVALLIEAVKEQQKQIEDLKLTINTIRN